MKPTLLTQTAVASLAAACFISLSLTASAQTVTTNGGATNSVPKFSSSTQIVNSAISENGGDINVNGNITVTQQRSLLFGTTCCGVTSPMGSTIGSTAGFNSNFNSLYFNQNGTVDGDNVAGAQINTSLPSWRMTLGSGGLEWGGGDNFAIGRVAAGANYSAPAVLLTVDNSGALHTAGGIVFPDGSQQTRAQVAGPPGPQGPQGIPGPPGPQGPPGPTPFTVCISQSSTNLTDCGCTNTDSFIRITGSETCTVQTATNSCTAAASTGNVGACCKCH